MILLDMDGTLLDDDKQIPVSNQKVLSVLHEKGVHIIIATGRRYWYAKPVLAQLGFPVMVLANNGNILWNSLTDEKLSSKTLSPHHFFQIIQEGRHRGLTPILHVEHYQEGIDLLIEQQKDDPVYHGYLKNVSERCKQIADFLEYENPKVMVMCYMGDLETLQRFEQAIQMKFPNQVHSHIVLSLKHLGPLLEITPPDGTKWHTAVEYAGTVGVKPCEIIAIGDDNNDIEMLQNAGLGIAMKNATDEAKKAASLITEYSNNQAGVAVVLKEVFHLTDNEVEN